MDFLISLQRLSVVLALLVGLSVFVGWRSEKPTIKHVCYNVAAILFCLFVYEVVILRDNSVGTSAKVLGTYKSEEYCYVDKDFVLGYGHSRSDRKFSSTKVYNEDTIYDVTYTVRDGMRYTPNSDMTSSEYAIFLGCSETFGEGLNDDETLAFYVNKLAGERYQVRNYGFHGYGTHQALALVENFILRDDALVNSKRVQVFYTFYYHHITRAAGYAPWDKVGPWYEVDGDSIVYKGSLRKKYKLVNSKYFGKAYARIWLNSNVYKKHFNEYLTVRSIKKMKSEDVNRAIYMIKKMNSLLSERGFEFYLIVDKDVIDGSQEFNRFLAKDSINAFCLECEIEDFDRNEDYRISGDSHSTDLLNRTKANILMSKIEMEM